MAKKPTRKSARKSTPRARKVDPVLEARRDLAAAFRWAARLGFNEGTCNHFRLCRNRPYSIAGFQSPKIKKH